MKTLEPSNAMARAAAVRMMIFDVDGILTDGSLYFGPEGEAIKRFHALDGHGIKMLQHAGIATAIISARQSTIVTRRAQDLGIAHLVQGAQCKRTALDRLLAQCGLEAQACGFMGDDILDLPVLSRVGFAVSVPNAHAEVRSRVHYETQALGGQGAAREICDFILRAQGKYDMALAPYLT